MYLAMFAADARRDGLEDRRRSGEVHARERRMIEARFDHRLRRPHDEVDDPVGEPRLAEQVEDLVRRPESVRRRFPDDRVPEERRCRRQVRRDRREIERRDRRDETFERARFERVPHARRGDRLLEETMREVDVEAQEVDELARRIDLGLDARLALTEHRRGVEAGSPAPGREFGRPKEDRASCRLRRARPSLPRRERGFDGSADVRLVAFVRAGEEEAVVVRRAHVTERTLWSHRARRCEAGSLRLPLPCDRAPVFNVARSGDPGA